MTTKRKQIGLTVVFLWLVASTAFAQSESQQVPADANTLPPELGFPIDSERPFEDSEDTYLDNLLSPTVNAATNHPEKRLTLPNSVITITREQLIARGYRELTDLLDDIPGVDAIRPHGHTYVQTYWRGSRTYLTAPVLFMIDGVIFNHLWLNTADIMATLPLSNIERVEIVYGSTSVVYGTNAALATINVVTRTFEEEGAKTSGQFYLQSPQTTFPRIAQMTKVADVSSAYRTKWLELRLTGRIEFGFLDEGVKDRFEYLQDTYATDRTLWGGFLDHPEVAGRFRSPSEKQALDLRLRIGREGGTELGFQHYRMVNGAGLTHPTDRVQSRVPLALLDQSLFLRHHYQFHNQFSSRTLLQYRRSDVNNPTAWIERAAINGSLGDADLDTIEFRYQSAVNSAFVATQDFSVDAARQLFFEEDQLHIDFGLKYERKNLQREYDQSGLTISTSTSAPVNLRPPVERAENLEFRNPADVFGIYGLARYQITEGHNIRLGLRIDYNSYLADVEPLIHLSYVGNITKALTLRLAYGRSTQNPSWREVFVGDQTQFSNFTNLRNTVEAERSNTFELGAVYEVDPIHAEANIYFIQHTSALFLGQIDSSTTSGTPGSRLSDETTPFLTGTRNVLGADAQLLLVIPVPDLGTIDAWVYLSAYFLANEKPSTVSTTVNAGDLAMYKGMVGLTARLTRHFEGTALGRCLGSRTPGNDPFTGVPTNPLGAVATYCTVDVHLMAKNFIAEGLSASIRVTNLTGAAYDHPGLKTASSNINVGSFQTDGSWLGSEGLYNSRLPQPGRQFFLRLGLDF